MARALQSRNAREYTTLNNSDKPIRNPYVVLREEFDDWAVLFNPDTGQGFGTNPTGVSLWKLLDGEHSIDEMLSLLRRESEGVPEDASAHVLAFINTLAAEGLIDPQGSGHSPGGSPALPREVNDVHHFTYEAPKLIYFGGGQRALGVCASHGSIGGDCQNGTGATGCCYATGGCPTTTVLNCCYTTGACAVDPCCAYGNAASTGDCTNGNKAGAARCITGNHP